MAELPTEIVLDPHFQVPPLLVDARQWTEEEDSFLVDDEHIESEPTEVDSLLDYGTTAPIVTNLRVIEQIVRITSDGRTVVDVVVEIEGTDQARVEYAKL